MKNQLKLSVVLLLLITTPLGTYAQFRTPFETVAKDENGKRQYIRPNPHFGRSSATLSYGFMPMSAMNWWASPMFDSKFQLGKEYASETKTNIGVISLAYNNQITPWLELQIPISYSYSTGNFTNTPRDFNSYYYESWVSMVPNVKISWAFNDLIHLYSRVGLGVGIGNRYENFNAGMNSKAAFMWQLSPIGFEIGRRARFFIEAGFGQMGIVNAGVKIVFNKSDVKPDGTKREIKQWYERI